MADDTYTMVIPQGRTLRKVFVWEGEDGSPQPMGGYKAIMQIKDKEGVLMLEATSDPAAGFTIEPGGATGELHMRLGADQTAQVLRKGYYDIILVDVNDPTEVVQLVSGRAPLDEAVTL